MKLRILRLNIKNKIKFNKLGVGILVLILGFFIFQKNIEAKENENIVINEIMYNPEKEGVDWVEIFNKGEDVNIGKWKLIDEYELEKNKKGDKYLNCHNISDKNEFIIKAGEYIVISKSDESDLQIKSLSLSSGNKDAVRISDNNCETFIDEVEYNPKKEEKVNKGYSLELDNGRWRESYNIDGKTSTPGEENSKKPKPKEYEKNIRMNELLPNPNKNNNESEFIELYNFGNKKIDLNGWKLIDKKEIDKSIKEKEGDRVIILSEIIESKKYLILEKGFSLNNNGNRFLFKNPNDELVDEVLYENSKKGFSYSFNEKDKKWRWSTFLTPGDENKFDEDIIYPNKIRINEILPNPKGEENEGEFVELYNYEKKDINLENWTLKDSSKTGKYIFPENKIIKAGGFLKIYRKDFKFALNNSGGEVVYLLNPKGEEVFMVKYDSAKENVSYGFDSVSNKWRWSRFLTPGEKNIFDKIPKIKINIDNNIYEDIYADFEVKIDGIKKEELKIKWDFGDNHKSYKQKTRHKYKKEGSYNVTVSVFNGSESFEFKNNIEVKIFPQRDVEIISFMPNPKGKDTEGEWIEIKNNYKKKINLNNWSIATGKDKKSLINHPINKKFQINQNKTEKINREYSYFSLNNKEGYIELRYPDGKVADSVGYENKRGIKDDDIYKKDENGEWVWVIFENKSVEIDNVDQKPEVKGEEDVDISFLNIGKRSFIEIDKNKIFFSNYRLKREIVSLVWENNKGVRIENGVYYFNPIVKKQKHYLVKIFEEKFKI